MKKTVLDFAAYVCGAACTAIAVSCFAAPNNIAAGGFSGIATLINYLTALPIGVSVLVLNIPVFIAGAYSFGMKFLYKSLAATVFLSVFIDLATAFLPKYSGDQLLSAIFGGVFSGFGLAIVFIRGATTGGVDIIAKIINNRLPHISMGNLILALDAAVVIAAAIVYRNLESALYAVVMIFVQSKTIDALVYGLDKGKVLLINSLHYAEIASEIMAVMHRGVTMLDAKGAYRGDHHPLILCAVRPYEAAALHRIVKKIDKTAFLVSLDAGEILGEGFKTT